MYHIWVFFGGGGGEVAVIMIIYVIIYIYIYNGVSEREREREREQLIICNLSFLKIFFLEKFCSLSIFCIYDAFASYKAAMK